MAAISRLGALRLVKAICRPTTDVHLTQRCQMLQSLCLGFLVVGRLVLEGKSFAVIGNCLVALAPELIKASAVGICPGKFGIELKALSRSARARSSRPLFR